MLKNIKLKGKNNVFLTLFIIIFLFLIVLFFYLDRKNQLSTLIRAWGIWGILLSILLMAALCMTPIPSEGFYLLLLKIFGVFLGPIYSWLGSIISAFVIYYLVHYFGKSLFQKLITPKYFETVDNWVKKRGSVGLLAARILPIPAFIVNYIAAAMPSISLWPYVWTSAVSIIPYYLGTTLVYIGVAKSTWIWLVAGVTAIIVVFTVSYQLNKKTNLKKNLK